MRLPLRPFLRPLLRLFSRLAALMSICTPLLWPASASAQGAVVTTPQVRAELVAHAPQGVAAGQPMQLALRIEHQPHWHTYWKNPGDSGLPTSLECPSWETGETVTPSPHHPLGLKGIGESATVGSPAAVVNAVVDALEPFGVRHADMPLTPANVWMAMQGKPVRTDLAVQ